MTEAQYHKMVEAWLLESFSDVVHEPTLASGREPDFAAFTPFENYVIEVEDSTDSLYTGIGQCLVYADETGYTPVLVLPADDPPDSFQYGPVEVETV